MNKGTGSVRSYPTTVEFISMQQVSKLSRPESWMSAMSCSRLKRNGVYLDVLQPTSSPRYLAAQLGYYGYRFCCTPYRTVDATIDLEKGQMKLGHPLVAEIYPSGLARSKPTDTTQFKLDVGEHEAKLTDLSKDSTVNFNLYASPLDRNPEYGWFVGPQFKLAYVLYENHGGSC